MVCLLSIEERQPMELQVEKEFIVKRNYNPILWENIDKEGNLPNVLSV